MWFLIAAALFLLPPLPAAGSEPPVRSARAYEHWVRAHLALARGDGAAASRELLLAEVYDEQSPAIAAAQARLARSDRIRRFAVVEAKDRVRAASLRAEWAEADGRLDAALRFARQAARSGTKKDLERLWRLTAAVEGPAASRAPLEEAARRHPGWAEPLRGLALLERSPERALALLEVAAAGAEDPRPAVLALVEIDRRLGEPGRAAARLEAALAAWPDDPELWRAVVAARQGAGDLSGAAAAAADGRRLGPLDPSVASRTGDRADGP